MRFLCADLQLEIVRPCEVAAVRSSTETGCRQEGGAGAPWQRPAQFARPVLGRSATAQGQVRRRSRRLAATPYLLLRLKKWRLLATTDRTRTPAPDLVREAPLHDVPHGGESRFITTQEAPALRRVPRFRPPGRAADAPVGS